MGAFRNLKSGYRENSSRVKYSDVNEEKGKEFQTKKIWTVLANGKLYLFKRLKKFIIHKSIIYSYNYIQIWRKL